MYVDVCTPVSRIHATAARIRFRSSPERNRHDIISVPSHPPPRPVLSEPKNELSAPVSSRQRCTVRTEESEQMGAKLQTTRSIVIDVLHSEQPPLRGTVLPSAI